MASKIQLWLLAVVVGFVGLTGCGGSIGGSDAGAGTSGGGTSGGGTTGSGGTTGTGGSGAPTCSGVTGTKRVDTLTTAEKQLICDCAAAHFGGYGQTIDCGDGSSIETDPDQATCVATAPTNCAATVSQYETCIMEASCSNLIPASCLPIIQCS